MAQELSFESACKILSGDQDPSAFAESLGDVGAGLLALAGFVDGGVASTLWKLLSPTRALAKLGGKVIDAVSTSIDDAPGPDIRLARLQAADVCIVYAAWLDQAIETLPAVMDALGPSSEGMLSRETLSQHLLEEPCFLPVCRTFAPTLAQQHISDVERLYERLALRLKKLIQEILQNGHPPASTNIGDSESELDKGATRTIDEIRDLALHRYLDQAVALAIRYGEYAVWTQLHALEELKSRFAGVEQTSNVVARLLEEQQINGIVTLGKVSALEIALAERKWNQRESESLKSLKRTALQDANAPLVPQSERWAEQEGFHFSTLAQGFIPQPFRIHPTPTSTSVEDEKVWKTQKRQIDLPGFLQAWFASPDSLDAPLLILGNPGSGKSVLARSLSVWLASTPMVPILVRLRDVPSDAPPIRQVEYQLKKTTDISVDWGGLRPEIGPDGAATIFDGLDELSRAQDSNTSGYLEKIQDMQRHQRQAHKCSLRAVVTSRIALIQDVRIPPGTCVIRLDHFDDIRMLQWSEIWNKDNAGKLPRMFTPGKLDPKLLQLAREPLFLFMLALYDAMSEDGLAKTSVRGRASVYRELIELFIARQVEKGTFGLHPSGELNHLLFRELGLQGLGMLQRGREWLSVAEIESDLQYFFEKRPTDHIATKLLGNFFFVHESRVNEESAAYEFLHATFGEFLAASEIARSLEEACEDIRERRHKDRALSDLWHSEHPLLRTLAWSSFADRPVVLDFLREILTEPPPELSELAIDQLNRSLREPETAPLKRLPSHHGGVDRPSILRQLATHSLNLVLCLCQFNDEWTLPYETWRGLTYLWRSAFSDEHLSPLLSLFSSSIGEDVVLRRVKATPGKESVDKCRNVTAAGAVVEAIGSPIERVTFELATTSSTKDTMRLARIYCPEFLSSCKFQVDVREALRDTEGDSPPANLPHAIHGGGSSVLDWLTYHKRNLLVRWPSDDCQIRIIAIANNDNWVMPGYSAHEHIEETAAKRHALRTFLHQGGSVNVSIDRKPWPIVHFVNIDGSDGEE